MKAEIERKFLTLNSDWRAAATERIVLKQGYVPRAKGGPTVRVRIAGEQGFLTLKGPTQGITRLEFEYPIPREDAEAMLKNFCGVIVEKFRWLVPFAGRTWEVDEFQGANEGLVVAELELEREDEPFETPPWLGREVSGDPRYFNSFLARLPYRDWGLQEGASRGS